MFNTTMYRLRPGALATAVLMTVLSVSPAQAESGNEAELLALASQGRTAEVMNGLSRRTDVDVAQPDGTTLLHWAVYYNDEALVRRLLRARADVDATNTFGSTPLQQAAINANADIIEMLIDAGADPNEPGADGQTPLMIVARSSAVDALEVLLEEKADPNVVEAWRGQTALMWASAQNQPEMVKLLLDAGADPDARSVPNNWQRQVTAEPRMKILPTGGLTPLLYAAREGCTECVANLIEAGADLNKTDPDGVTPLLMATLNARWDSARLLIEAGADVNKWDVYGRNPLYQAVDYNTLPHGGRPDRLSSDLTPNLAIIELLIGKGANVNMQLKLFPPYRALGPDRGADGLLRFGVTPLFRAARGGDLAAARLLLDNGAGTDLTNEDEVTILMAATGFRQSDIDTRGKYRDEEQALAMAKLLFEADPGLDVNARENGGQTALFGAATLGWTRVVELLLEHGADPNLSDAGGFTALDAAMGRAGMFGRGAGGDAHPETAAVLQAAMSDA